MCGMAQPFRQLGFLGGCASSLNIAKIRTMPGTEEIKVFITTRASTCDECKEDLGRKAWITLNRDKGALCLSCADLDQLDFLPRGDAALTRRARKHSVLSAVVLKWSTARKHYERQGLLVEEKALDQAESECLADSEARARRKEREQERRAEQDHEYIQSFAKRVRELFPHSPPNREREIAEHACRKYTGRIGRSAAAKTFHEDAIRLAVLAHIRHRETNYDTLLNKGLHRSEARSEISAQVNTIRDLWESR